MPISPRLGFFPSTPERIINDFLDAHNRTFNTSLTLEEYILTNSYLESKASIAKIEELNLIYARLQSEFFQYIFENKLFIEQSNGCTYNNLYKDFAPFCKSILIQEKYYPSNNVQEGKYGGAIDIWIDSPMEGEAGFKEAFRGIGAGIITIHPEFEYSEISVRLVDAEDDPNNEIGFKTHWYRALRESDYIPIFFNISWKSKGGGILNIEECRKLFLQRFNAHNAFTKIFMDEFISTQDFPVAGDFIVGYALSVEEPYIYEDIEAGFRKYVIPSEDSIQITEIL
ncbi:MAG: hypothetical protein ACRCYP_05285 [Alphaproteobacteria bacterium]